MVPCCKSSVPTTFLDLCWKIETLSNASELDLKCFISMELSQELGFGMPKLILNKKHEAACVL